MKTAQIVVDRVTARGLYLQYRRHRHYAQAVDREIEATYRAIARGEVVIAALASVIGAGLGGDGWPKLALVRADAESCFLTLRRDGSARMAMQRWTPGNHRRTFFDFAAGSFAAPARWGDAQALAPLVPLAVRPRRGLENYHVLYEAVWTKAPPVDPILVRRIGVADLWVVCASWELGEVERAVLAGRMQ